MGNTCAMLHLQKSLYLCATLIAGMASTLPLTARAESILLEAGDLMQLGGIGWVATGLDMPRPETALPIIEAADNSPEAALLRRLDNAGKAAGFDGVLYDNRDRGHSLVPADMFPRLIRLEFGPELRKQNMDYGVAGQIVLPAIVIGNSSTAITGGEIPRSQARLAMTVPEYSRHAFLSYVSNHLYIYPEHRDYDGHDRFPVNWPYTVISEGSSHSDKPFMRAFLMSVAALAPETRDRLREESLVVPTLQMVMRRSQPGIYSRDAYKAGQAHRAVFAKDRLAPERMVALAASLKPDEIPPMVRLRVEEEDFRAKAGLAGMPEQLFNTPSSIARIWRGPGYSRLMVVSAADTEDPNGRDLEFSWVLLQGDPARVRITPEAPGAARAQISIDWHDRFKADPDEARTTDRVDIGVFAWNGVHESAPAIISISFPNHQRREYESSPDDTGMRLTSVDYDAKARGAAYDPLLHWSAPWKDMIRYDDTGEVTELLRETRDGVLELSGRGRIQDGRTVTYTLERDKQDRILSMQVTPTE